MNVWNTLLGAFHTVADARPLYVLSAVTLYAVSVIIAGARWGAVLSGMRCHSRLKDTSLGILIGIFLSNITPSSRMGGEIGRIAFIRKRAKIDLKKATISILYDRLTELVSAFFLLALAFPVIRRWTDRLDGFLWTLFATALVGCGLFIIYRRMGRIREWVSRQRDRLESIRIEKAKFAQAIGYSTLVWVQDFVRLMVVAAAFRVMLSPSQAATLSLVTLFCGLIPSIGGVGPTEGGLTTALHLFGVPLETALAITLLERAISYVLSTCAGSLILAAMGGRKLLLRRNQSEDF